ncbi:unnamed protein product [Anisakis simplex]|uniref:Transposase n=1 Tax=Anisakis simplex TaxID=6269 RepID=A0A0M3JSL3_ANISI|nr:unnamed protein product [Anisakis simplex]
MNERTGYVKIDECKCGQLIDVLLMYMELLRYATRGRYEQNDAAMKPNAWFGFAYAPLACLRRCHPLLRAFQISPFLVFPLFEAQFD